MGLLFRYNGMIQTHNVEPTTVSLPMRAEMGETSFGAVPFEDPAASLSMIGHRSFSVDEDTSTTQPRLFTGWTTERSYMRSAENALLVGDDRWQDTTIVDCNAAFSFRMIKGTDGNRPEETWNARLAWLLASNYLAGTSGALVEDTGFLMSSTVVMDAADYRGTYPAAVLDDLAARFEGRVNYFAWWDPAVSKVSLFFNTIDSVTGDCTLRVSNVLADIDGTVTFGADKTARLAREPDQVYSEVVVEYANGSVFRSRPSTAATHIRRGTKISRPYIGKSATALLAAEQFLDAHATEKDRITCTMQQVPSESVGLVRAGQRISVKFSHMPGYTAWTWMRIAACTPNPTNDEGNLYDIALELVGIAPPVGLSRHGGCGEEVAPYAWWIGFDSPPTPGNLIILVGYGWGGDAAIPAGFTVDLTATSDDGMVHAFLAHRIAAAGDPAAWLSPGDAGAERYFNIFEFTGYGAPTATDTDVVAAHGGYSMSVSPAGTGGMIFGIFVQHSGGHNAVGRGFGEALIPGTSVDFAPTGTTTDYLGITCYPTRTMLLIGQSDSAPMTADRDWNDYQANALAAFYPLLGGDDEETPIAMPVRPRTTVTTTAPTVNDDVTLGFAVGDHWINTTTGIEYVLVDATDGAASWLSTAPGAPMGADYLVGTAQAGLSAEIVVGTTPGGALGGTWASPTVPGLTTHIAAATDAHDASAISVLDTGGHFTGTEVETVLDELYMAISGGGIPATLIDAKGDLIVGSAADTAGRLPIGSNTYVLTADSTETLGTKWAPVGGGLNLPTLTQAAINTYAGTGTSVVATLGTAPTNGNYIYAGIGSTGRGCDSITQTNVTWTKIYSGNGNSQYFELWKGTVGASAGTGITANFTGSNKQEIAVAELGTLNLSTAGTAKTVTAASGTVVNFMTVPLATVTGDYVILGISANAPSSQEVKLPINRLPFAPTGGQVNVLMARSPGGSIVPWASLSNSVAYFGALFVLS